VTEGAGGPNRIQRKRTAGWKMPDGAIYVGRGSRWGNPYRVGSCLIPDAETAVAVFRANFPVCLDLSELRGKTLACWCKVGSACHGDVLLELANTPARAIEDV
jgi:Domain of unknown function (DUF4326)